MDPKWIFWTVSVLIAVSVIYEIVTGTSRVRGMGDYSREERPAAFWTAVILKGILALVVLGTGLSMR